MRRISVFVTIALLAGFSIGYFTRGAVGTLQQRYRHKVDLAAIEKVHEEDIEATLMQDPKGLMDLWAEDAVAFYPGSPPAVGKQAIGAVNEKFHAQNPGFKVLSYTSNTRTFKSRTAWHASGSKKQASISCLPSPLRPVGTLTDWLC